MFQINDLNCHLNKKQKMTKSTQSKQKEGNIKRYEQKLKVEKQGGKKSVKPKAGSLKTSIINKTLPRLIKKKERTQITNIMNERGGIKQILLILKEPGNSTTLSPSILSNK